ncbi:hypothetical protein B0H10DRAFT_559964 [Mycena sp. CBHHK59/15]|nr:hypothetical protein B0H10DRAFT_559964 [Mycena sp. CBHHK59/15]
MYEAFSDEHLKQKGTVPCGQLVIFPRATLQYSFYFATASYLQLPFTIYITTTYVFNIRSSFWPPRRPRRTPCDTTTISLRTCVFPVPVVEIRVFTCSPDIQHLICFHSHTYRFYYFILHRIIALFFTYLLPASSIQEGTPRNGVGLGHNQD